MSQATAFPQPRAMCVICEHIEVPLRTRVCNCCYDAFSLVDDQVPEKAQGEKRAELIQIGPTDC